MNINQLKYLVETVKAGSINKAADALYMSQSSLSGAISHLEKELELKLLERTAHGVSLTAAGKIIYEDALDILATVARWESIDPEQLTEIIDVPIYSIPTYYNGFLNDFILDFVLLHPRINILLKERSRVDCLHALQEKDRTITLTCFYPNEQADYEMLVEQKHFKMDILFQDSYSIYVSKRHPLSSQRHVTLAELRDLPAIIYSDIKLRDEPQFKYLHNHPTIRLDRMNNILQMVSQNKGFTLMPKSLARYYPGIHPLAFDIDAESLTMNCVLIHARSASLSHAEKTVISAIKQFASERLAALE